MSLAQPQAVMSQDGRVTKACTFCHQRKVRCNFESDTGPCTNCRKYSFTCRPHERKRARHSQGVIERNEEGPSLNQQWADSPSKPTEMLTPESRTQGYDAQRQSYLGRSEYLGGDVPFVEDITDTPRQGSPRASSTATDIQYLTFQKAFEMPSRSVCAGLIDAFMERCHPWMPIVERKWLEENDRAQPSPLLLQAVFLAGSRVSSGALGPETSNQFYERARALFFHGHESNAVLWIVAASLLHWWNPTGPEKVSKSTSGFWVSIGATLAYQVGLHIDPGNSPGSGFRRRLWWTLRSRDSLISVAVGRPRILNGEDSNVKQISLKDFDRPDDNSRLFSAYVTICMLLGDIAEAHRRGALSTSRRSAFEDSLLRWSRVLHPQLRVFQANRRGMLSEYNSKAWQLSVPYLVSLIVLNRSSNPNSPGSTACLVASSLIVGILEDFISRGHLTHLGPVWAFYALAAGLCQLTGYSYVSLRPISKQEVAIVRTTLETLSERWGSAAGALRSLTRTEKAVELQVQVDVKPEALSTHLEAFFDDFGPALCRLWHLRAHGSSTVASQRNINERSQDLDPGTEGDREGARVDLQAVVDFQDSDITPSSQSNRPLEDLAADMYSIDEESFPFLEASEPPVGSWLFDSLIYDEDYCAS